MNIRLNKNHNVVNMILMAICLANKLCFPHDDNSSLVLTVPPDGTVPNGTKLLQA